jgi:hypothetical protein
VLVSRLYQLLVVNSKGKTGDTKEWVCEVLKYRGATDLLSEFEQWTLPRFPLSGNILMEKGVPGENTVCALKSPSILEFFKVESFSLHEYVRRVFFFN